LPDLIHRPPCSWFAVAAASTVALYPCPYEERTGDEKELCILVHTEKKLERSIVPEPKRTDIATHVTRGQKDATLMHSKSNGGKRQSTSKKRENPQRYNLQASSERPSQRLNYLRRARPRAREPGIAEARWRGSGAPFPPRLPGSPPPPSSVCCVARRYRDGGSYVQ